MAIWWPGPWGAGIQGSGGARKKPQAESPHQEAIASPEPEEEKEPVCPMPEPKKARTRKTALLD